MYDGGTYLRRLWQNKPKQWGPFSAVQLGLFNNAEKIGINPAKIVCATPIWGPGTVHDYSKNRKTASYGSASYENGYLKSTGATCPVIDAPTDFSDLAKNTRSAFFTFHPGSTGLPWWDTYFMWTDAGNGTHSLLYGRGTSQAAFNLGSQTKIVNLPDTYDINASMMVDTITDTHIYGLNSELVEEANSMVWFQQASKAYLGNFDGTESSTHTYLKQVILSSERFSIDTFAKLNDNPYQLWQPPTFRTYSIPADGGQLPINLNGASSISAAPATSGTATTNKKRTFSGTTTVSESPSVAGTLTAGTTISKALTGSASIAAATGTAGTAISCQAKIIAGSVAESQSPATAGSVIVGSSLSQALSGAASISESPATTGSTTIQAMSALVGGAAIAESPVTSGTLTAGTPQIVSGTISVSDTTATAGSIITNIIARASPSLSTGPAVSGRLLIGLMAGGAQTGAAATAAPGRFFSGLILSRPIVSPGVSRTTTEFSVNRTTIIYSVEKI
jgi:hypothetical protein